MARKAGWHNKWVRDCCERTRRHRCQSRGAKPVPARHTVVQESPDQGVARPFESIGGRFPIIHQGVEAVEARFLRERNGEIDGPYILLAPPQKSPNIVCLLGIYWDLGENESQMSLYLNMFGPSQIKDVKTWHRGYRLELAHKAGIHGYTHVQPVKATGWAKRTQVVFTDPGVPDSFPAFPIRGSTLTTLCALLVVSLHGKRMLATVTQWLRGNRSLRDVQHLLSD